MLRYSLQFPLAFFLLSYFIIGCQPASAQTGPEPAIVTHSYISSDAPLLNPERGFFTPYDLPGPVGFSPVRATGNTLVHLNIRLDGLADAAETTPVGVDLYIQEGGVFLPPKLLRTDPSPE